MVLKKHREASDVLIVDVSKEFFKDGNKNRLSGHHIKKIVDAVLARQDIPHFATLVPKNDVINNDYNLNIPRYVEAERKVPVDLHATIFGGIPNYEIELLWKYWDSFPSLRDELFARQDEHTSVIKCESVRNAIKQNRDVSLLDIDLTTTLCISPAKNALQALLRFLERVISAASCGLFFVNVLFIWLILLFLINSISKSVQK